MNRHRALAAVVLTLFAATAAGCVVQESESDEPQATRDTSGFAALVSACLAYTFADTAMLLSSPVIGGASLELRACLSEAADCEAVLGCMGYTRSPCPEPDSLCDGDRALHCLSLAEGLDVVYSENCADDPNGNTSCDIVSIEGKEPRAACNAGPCSRDRCEDDVLYACDGDREVRTVCSSQRSCHEYEPFASCELPDECARDHCDGDALVVCQAGFVHYRENCAAIIPGTRCRTTEFGAECAAESLHPTCPAFPLFSSFCEGDIGVACQLGARFEVDCSAIGAACVEGPEVDKARCRLPGASD